MEKRKPKRAKEVTDETKSKILEIGDLIRKKDASHLSVHTSSRPSSEEKSGGSSGKDAEKKKKLSIDAKAEVEAIRRASDARSTGSSKHSSGSSVGADEENEETEAAKESAESETEEMEDEIEEVQELTNKELEVATAMLEKHIQTLEEERIKDEAKKREDQKKKEDLDRQEKEVEELWAKSFVPVGRQLQMLKTSMRFVPGVNTTPNVKGHADDPPYLFKTAGRVYERKRKIEYSVLSKKSTVTFELPVPEPPPPPPAVDPSSSPTAEKVPEVKPKSKFPRPVFGLNWPSQGSQIVYRSHHNLLVAFLAYYNRKAEAEAAGFSGTDLYDPSLSISCSIACGKSPYPPTRTFLPKLPQPVDSSAMYTPVAASSAGGVDGDWQKVASQVGFWPPGFGPQKDGTFVPLPMEYYMPQNQPYFPDAEELAQMVDIPAGATVGYLDSSGNFYVPEAGDPLPPDAAIGYIDEEGNYHHVLDLVDGMQDGRIPYKQVYPYYPSDEDDEFDVDPYGEVAGHHDSIAHGHYQFPHGSLAPGTFPGGFHSAFGPRSIAAGMPHAHFPPGYPAHLPVAKIHPRPFVSEEEYLPGDPTHHQSEVVFTGEGAIAAKKNEWEADSKKKKRRKKREQRKTIYLRESHDGMHHGHHEHDEEEDGEDSGSDWGSDEDDDDEEEEGEAGPYKRHSYRPHRSIRASNSSRLPPPPIMYDTSMLTDPMFPSYINQGYTKQEIIQNMAPHGARAGYLDENGQFVEVKDGEEFPDNVSPGYMDENGVFHQLLIPAISRQSIAQLQAEIPAGFVDENGQFHSTHAVDNTGAQFGFIDEDGDFHILLPGEKAPEGATLGHLDRNGMFHVARKLPPGGRIGHMDEAGNFQALKPGEEMPMEGQGGYMDENGVFHPAPPPMVRQQKKGSYSQDAEYEEGGEFGEFEDGGAGPSARPKTRREPPVSTKPSRYIEDANELIEVEIRDENDLDEHGQPKIRVILRHRGSIAAPANARDIEGGGKVWIEGNEEVTEMPYLDHNDLDEDGKPKVKRMRVRKRLGEDQGVSSGGQRRTFGPMGRQGRNTMRPRTGEDDGDDYADLRSQPMSQAERERLLEFQRNVGIQVEMDYIEGSLDLGEVVRKSFRIYSHGGSIDVDPAALVHRASLQMASNGQSPSAGNVSHASGSENHGESDGH